MDLIGSCSVKPSVLSFHESHILGFYYLLHNSMCVHTKFWCFQCQTAMPIVMWMNDFYSGWIHYCYGYYLRHNNKVVCEAQGDVWKEKERSQAVSYQKETQGPNWQPDWSLCVRINHKLRFHAHSCIDIRRRTQADPPQAGRSVTAWRLSPVETRQDFLKQTAFYRCAI